MVAPNTLTHNLTPARRPSLDDVGGGGLEDDQQYPPDPRTMPYAAAMNQGQRQIEALNRTASVIGCSIRFAAGAPFVFGQTSLTDGVLMSDFTITDHGVGDTSIQWVTAQFAPPLLDPSVSITGSVPGMASIEYIVIDGTHASVRVRTYDKTGTATDLPFTFTVV